MAENEPLKVSDHTDEISIILDGGHLIVSASLSSKEGISWLINVLATTGNALFAGSNGDQVVTPEELEKLKPPC
jgi:hypothetical protein